MNSNLPLLILQPLFRLISRNPGVIIVHQDTVGRAFHVIKLAAFHCPYKGPHGNAEDHHPKRNQQIKNLQLHLLYYINGPRPALVESQGVQHYQ